MAYSELYHNKTKLQDICSSNEGDDQSRLAAHALLEAQRQRRFRRQHGVHTAPIINFHCFHSVCAPSLRSDVIVAAPGTCYRLGLEVNADGNWAEVLPTVSLHQSFFKLTVDML